MTGIQFENKQVKEEYIQRLEALKHIINEPIADTRYLWDEMVKDYALNIERIQRILAVDEIKPHISNKLVGTLNHFLDRCANPEFHIAIVGTIKSGKSTLVNAFLGYDLASTQVTPETAALTKFKRAENNYVKVVFYSKDEWDILWKSVEDSHASIFIEEYKMLHADTEKGNWLGKGEQQFACEDYPELKAQIAKWTSSKSPAHYFVKEVIVGLKDFDLPEGVVLVDTPGLDDVVEYRSNITRGYIDRANAVLVCVRSDALTGGELMTILRVFDNTRHNVEKVYVVATQIDTPNRPKEAWEEQSKEWMKYLKGDECYRDAELARNKIIPTSAYLYIMLKQFKDAVFAKGDDKYYDFQSILTKLRISEPQIDEKYQELVDFTNIDFLKTKLKKEMISEHKQLLTKDIIEAYKICQEELNEKMSAIKSEQNEIIETANSGIEAIRSKKNEYEHKLSEMKAEKEELAVLLKEMKLATTKRADELIREIRKIGK